MGTKGVHAGEERGWSMEESREKSNAARKLLMQLTSGMVERDSCPGAAEGSSKLERANVKASLKAERGIKEGSREKGGTLLRKGSR